MLLLSVCLTDCVNILPVTRRMWRNCQTSTGLFGLYNKCSYAHFAPHRSVLFINAGRERGGGGETCHAIEQGSKSNYRGMIGSAVLLCYAYVSISVRSHSFV